MLHLDDLRSAIILSLYVERGSFWADELLGISLGSDLHRLKRSPLNDETISLAREYCLDALKWLKSDGFAEKIAVSVTPDGLSKLRIKVNIDGTTKDTVYDL